MPKTVTIRLSDEDYKKILLASDFDHRPISNFITQATLKQIEESYYADAVEMAQIRGDKKLMGKLAAGHRDAGKMRGRFAGRV